MFRIGAVMIIQNRKGPTITWVVMVLVQEVAM